MHVGDHVAPVDLDPNVAGRAQRNVQRRAVLGHVDVFAGEHRVDARPQTGTLGEREQEAHRLVGDELLGVVEEEIAGLGREPVGATGVAGEQLTQVHATHRLGVGRDGSPFRGIGDLHSGPPPGGRPLGSVSVLELPGFSS